MNTPITPRTPLNHPLREDWEHIKLIINTGDPTQLSPSLFPPQILRTAVKYITDKKDLYDDELVAQSLPLIPQGDTYVYTTETSDLRQNLVQKKNTVTRLWQWNQRHLNLFDNARDWNSRAHMSMARADVVTGLRSWFY
ncbi:hypothetical protein EJ08DRAFT_662535 [Tothia fuscella]|uniref:Uncharacterized protein n=1 Tax=Tothia fuscella TaxID=1048955 RepID=A0A9P4NN31_9PEZI|nr:hypothetical protein EJ08DRAFT_662535 [Tothia fuscella]